MRINDVVKSEECRSIFDEVNAFVTLKLKDYNDDIQANGLNTDDKDIFDIVWGTVNLNSTEVCILDSPLLQRLRYIKQLGLVYILFPNADHSRFSHTIGVVEAAGRMAAIIDRHTGGIGSKIYVFKEIVRFAAIFHDAGHMFFSHVTEIYFSNNKSYQRLDEIHEMINFFNTITGADVSLHEILSVMIVNSDETMRFFQNISQHLKTRLTSEEHFEQYFEYISSLIIGVPVDREILPYSKIINSEIDADKLDYLWRDSYCTKVPIAVDLSRIIEKLDVIPLKESDEPKDLVIWNNYSETAVPLRAMAVKHSAKKVFWQLSIARSFMHESIYYHHKVLTVHAMLAVAFDHISDYFASLSFTEILNLSDSFIEYADLIIPRGYHANKQYAQAIHMLENIKNRNLLKRVAAFSQHTMTAPLVVSKNFINKVIKKNSEQESLNFYNLLTAEYNYIRTLFGKEAVNKPYFLFIEAKIPEREAVPIELGAESYVWSSKAFKQEPWWQAKESKQEQYFLVTDQIERGLVFLALEKILKNNYGIKLSVEAPVSTKISTTQFNKMRTSLYILGYYDYNLDLLSDDLFERLYDKNLFNIIINKFQSFNGVNNSKVTRDSLSNYLRQFLYLECTKDEISIIINGVLNILNKVIFIDRNFFADRLKIVLKQIKDIGYSKNYMTKLGGLRDSAGHLFYYFNDVKERKDFILIEKIEDALAMLTEADSISFFDDGAYSGTQVISIFQELMGIPAEIRLTEENHVAELDDANKERLRNANIILSYICFNPKSEKRILEELRKIGILKVKIIYSEDLTSKIFEDDCNIISNDGHKKLLKKYFRDIGEAILTTAKSENGELRKSWTPKRITNSALGYNDAQQIVVFESNIPTYSLSALWVNGEYGKHKWTGLFQRTDKD